MNLKGSVQISFSRISYQLLVILIKLLEHTVSTTVTDSNKLHAVYSNVWIVELNEGLNNGSSHPDHVASELGVINNGLVIPGFNYYEFINPKILPLSRHRRMDQDSAFQNHKHVRSSKQLHWTNRRKTSIGRYSFTDPLWNFTWYLTRESNKHAGVYSMNVLSAWNSGYTGSGIVVAVVDDGVDIHHPDLTYNINMEASIDVRDGDYDPSPTTADDSHGTKCAGVVAAVANNSLCSVGIAYNAKLSGLRLLEGDSGTLDSSEARVLNFQSDRISIYSNSWGPPSKGNSVDGPRFLTSLALLKGTTTGRQGKGSIYIFASGNEGMYHDSCACDGFASSIYTMAITSLTEYNFDTPYIEECSSVMATTYSSGYNDEGKVVTTDVGGICTTTFGGTSASAAMASGIVALALEANPKLTWRDVQYVTMLAANPEPMRRFARYIKNAAGREYSNRYGFGLMDAAKMCLMAKNWTNVGTQLKQFIPSVMVIEDRPINYNLAVRLAIPECNEADDTCIRYLEHIQLVVSLQSSFRGGVAINLTSPSQTVSTILHQRPNDNGRTFTKWAFMSLAFWGESPFGEWTIDFSSLKVDASITQYQLIIYGVSKQPDIQDQPTWFSCNEACDRQLGCYGPGAEHCRFCAVGYFLSELQNKCILECDDGYYEDKTERVCTACSTFSCKKDYEYGGGGFSSNNTTTMAVIITVIVFALVLTSLIWYCWRTNRLKCGRRDRHSNSVRIGYDNNDGTISWYSSPSTANTSEYFTDLPQITRQQEANT